MLTLSVCLYLFVSICDAHQWCQKGKGKVVYGQEPPSGEPTTTECGFNYQLLAVITEVAQWGAPSCSQPQPATDNGVRDSRSNWQVAPPTLHRAVPPELHVLHTAMRAANHKTRCTESAANLRLQNARPTHCRCGHSGYNESEMNQWQMNQKLKVIRIIYENKINPEKKLINSERN